jgi:ubiquitin-protein ligase
MAERFTVLTPELASRMLTVWERRRLAPRGTVYATTLLDAALAMPDHPPQPPRKFRFADGLKRPTWKHEKGSRS